MGLLTKLLIAVFVSSVCATLLIQIATELEGSYGVSYVNLTNGTRVASIISNITIYNSMNNDTLTAVGYAPGQPNALIIDSTNPSSSIQQSAFTSVLKIIPVVLFFPANFIMAILTFIGVPGLVIIMVGTLIKSVIIMFIAGILFYREW